MPADLRAALLVDVHADLPADVAELLAAVGAPPRLVAHLRLVHDVALSLLDGLAYAFPRLTFDRAAVLFGAATHDIGKSAYLIELSAPGSQHEEAGYQILLDHGFPADLARFARTHGTWFTPDRDLADLLVTLADKVWKGKRVEALELLITARIAAVTRQENWDVYMSLDDILTRIAAHADDRLAYQSLHPIGQ